jgi:hypothetical protein
LKKAIVGERKKSAEREKKKMAVWERKERRKKRMADVWLARY